jgi:hypothetical protein
MGSETGLSLILLIVIVNAPNRLTPVIQTFGHILPFEISLAVLVGVPVSVGWIFRVGSAISVMVCEMPIWHFWKCQYCRSGDAILAQGYYTENYNQRTKMQLSLKNFFLHKASSEQVLVQTS